MKKTETKSLAERMNEMRNQKDNPEYVKKLLDKLMDLPIADVSYWDGENSLLTAECVLEEAGRDTDFASELTYNEFLLIFVREVMSKCKFDPKHLANDLDHSSVFFYVILQQLKGSRKYSNVVDDLLDVKYTTLNKVIMDDYTTNHSADLAKRAGLISDSIPKRYGDKTVGEVIDKLISDSRSYWNPSHSIVDYQEEIRICYFKMYRDIIMLLSTYALKHPFSETLKHYDEWKKSTAKKSS